MNTNIQIGALIVGAALLLAATNAAAQSAQEGAAAESAKKEMEALQETLASLRAQTEAQNEAQQAAEGKTEQLRAETERLTAETAALQETVESLQKTAAEAKENPPAGYDSGFFIQSPKGALRLTVSGYVRPRYSMIWQRRYKTDDAGTLVLENGETVLDRKFEGNDFALDAARIEMRLRLLDRTEGVLSVDFAPETSEVLPPPESSAIVEAATEASRPLYFVDAYGEVRVFDALRIAAGQLKVPFDRETAFADRGTLFVRRSLMTRPYYAYAEGPAVSKDAPEFRAAYDVVSAASFGRDVGARLSGTALKERLAYGLGVFNGEGLNRENDNRDVLVSGRLSVSPLGPMTGEMSGRETDATPRVSVGFGAAYDLHAHPYPQEMEARYNASELSTTLDAAVTWSGLSAFAAVFYRRANHGDAFSDEKQVFHSLGATAQIAYYVSALHLEPAVRYSFYANQIDQSGNGVHEATAGLFYDAVPEHVRVGIEYSGLFPTDTDASYLSPDDVYYGLRSELSVSAELFF